MRDTDRLIRVDRHDDGLNSWEMARIAPPAPLAGTIAGYMDYHERTSCFTVRRELPHAEGVLIVNLGAPIGVTGGDGAMIRLGAGEAFAAGVHLRPALSHSDGSQKGMHVFLPLATLRRLLGIPMGEMIDRVVPLDAVLGKAARDLGIRLLEANAAEPNGRHARIALLDAALIARLAECPPVRAEVTEAIGLLITRPDLDIAAIARDIGWSRKHLAACVRDTVGVGPRSFRRLIRFQRLTAIMADDRAPDWAGLACDAGYCDQSHLIREFREFADMTPTEFIARSLGDGGGLIER
ncbi:MAG: helix-turn-helix domain-containing protein [Sphingomonas sp.]